VKRPLSVNVAELHQVAAQVPPGSVLWILANTNSSQYSITFPTKIVLYLVPVLAVRSRQEILRTDERKVNKSKVCFDNEYYIPNYYSTLAVTKFSVS
jgi:hypothetical protein